MAEAARKPGNRATEEDISGGTATGATRLLARFYLRFHISLLLLWSFSAGLLVTKAMLWAGVHSMLWRYPLTLLASYGAFFLGVRIWLAYVGADPFGSGRLRVSSLVDSAGNGGGFDLGSWRGSGAGTAMRGGVIYLVYSAPTVLADVAFQAMLAGGLVKSSQRWRDASWEMSLLKSTWIPFAIVFVLAVATAALAVKLFPLAHTLPEVIRAARGYLG